ncbi:hypothetical protein FFI89_021320 [Bradyrhizobium sp. KBS0727]|nr:hypothetical protein FFI71_021325 [Bradyrhizobium sp. KBS0725]QDW46057.1 hypothetical protein FFI89_021320 [Bradyrhizobium sp. KBS0727]
MKSLLSNGFRRIEFSAEALGQRKSWISGSLGDERDEICGPGVFNTEAVVCCVAGTPFASHQGMLNMLTTPALTFVFLGIVVGLGTAFVWVLWEFEQTSRHGLSKAHRPRDRVR